MAKVVITYNPSKLPKFIDKPFLMTIGTSHIRLSEKDLDEIISFGESAKKETR